MIHVSNLTVERGGKPVLNDVNISFGQGGITALIGPNGAGKSTLLHAMSGLLKPNRGRVEVEGLDLARARPADRARAIALLTQSENVTARLTVEDLVAFGRWPHHGGRPRAVDRAAVADAIATFDLARLADRPLEALSGGQRQRAFVAMAYAQDTPWMLLDEPLSALDPRHARDIMERLHRLSRPGPGQRSVVVVLHDLASAALYADRVVALKDGNIVTSGPRWLSFTDEMLSGLYDTGLAVRAVEGREVVMPV